MARRTGIAISNSVAGMDRLSNPLWERNIFHALSDIDMRETKHISIYGKCLKATCITNGPDSDIMRANQK